jgi:hypothetical protein
MLPSVIDKIIESELDKTDGKFMLNKNIGLTGKKFAQGSVSELYDNQEEANLYLKDASSFYLKHVNDTELWYVKQKGKRKPLKNGFYLIQTLIYDTIKANLYLLAKELEKQNIEVIAVKTNRKLFF